MTQKTYELKPVLTRDERASSQTFALKRFHRFLKNHLFYQIVDIKSKKSILDVCCGRGNDITAYKHASNIFLEDISLHQIAILKDRLPPLTKHQTVRIHSGSCFDDSPPWKNMLFDLVVCNFGLHYAATHDDIRTLFYNVHKVLPRGRGRFLIIYPDGKRILENSQTVHSGAWSAKKMTADKIVFNMGTDFVNSIEMCLSAGLLETLAKDAHLQIVYHEPFVANMQRPANLNGDYFALSQSYSALVLTTSSS